MRVEEKYEDVLQNIEFAVVSFDRKSNILTDEHCLKAYDLLKKKYTGELRGWKSENAVIEDPIVTELVNEIIPYSDLRLGKVSIQEQDVIFKSVDHPAIIKCFEKLSKSVNKWKKGKNSRRYIEFVSNFII